uniref:Uncharacterized protein n=1 Tax=Anopheles maculatus TaxID=74869 RepID=A0A182S9R4_9DIPT
MKQKRGSRLFNGLGLIVALWVGWLSVCAAPCAHAEYIPPGPKYKCPEKIKLIYPCVCTHGTDDGIYIQCENSNLASLSVAFINLANTNVPIVQLRLKRCKISHLEPFCYSHPFGKDLAKAGAYGQGCVVS